MCKHKHVRFHSVLVQSIRTGCKRTPYSTAESHASSEGRRKRTSHSPSSQRRRSSCEPSRDSRQSRSSPSAPSQSEPWSERTGVTVALHKAAWQQFDLFQSLDPADIAHCVARMKVSYVQSWCTDPLARVRSRRLMPPPTCRCRSSERETRLCRGASLDLASSSSMRAVCARRCEGTHFRTC